MKSYLSDTLSPIAPNNSLLVLLNACLGSALRTCLNIRGHALLHALNLTFIRSALQASTGAFSPVRVTSSKTALFVFVVVIPQPSTPVLTISNQRLWGVSAHKVSFTIQQTKTPMALFVPLAVALTYSATPTVSVCPAPKTVFPVNFPRIHSVTSDAKAANRDTR